MAFVVAHLASTDRFLHLADVLRHQTANFGKGLSVAESREALACEIAISAAGRRLEADVVLSEVDNTFLMCLAANLSADVPAR